MSGFLNSFNDTVAGDTATTTIQFVLPLNFDASLGNISFLLQDAEGLVYSYGVANNYSVSQSQNAVLVQAQVNLTIPSTIPTNNMGTAYQVSMLLEVPNEKPVYQNALIKVLPLTMKETGASDCVIIKGSRSSLDLTLPRQYNVVSANFYRDNDIINPTPPIIAPPVPTADGFVYSIKLNTQQIQATLNPYSVIWLYGDSPTELDEQTQSSIYVVTPSMMQAAKDLLLRVNKARTSIGDRPTYSIDEMMSYLRRGADWFNAYSLVTTFSMTNAKNGIREYWIKFSEVIALRSQYMYEGETAFDFQGQAVSLNIDRSQYYEGLASVIENEVLEPTRMLKQQLAKRGNTDGDGSVDPNALRRGAIGSLGISLTPVSNLRLGNPNSYFFGIRPFW